MAAERTRNSRSNTPDFERIKSMRIFIRHHSPILRHNHTYQKVKELFVGRYRQFLEIFRHASGPCEITPSRTTPCPTTPRPRKSCRPKSCRPKFCRPKFCRPAL